MSIRLVLAVLASISGSAALAADIHVMTGGAPKEVLGVLTPQFEKQTGHKVHFTYIVIAAMQQKLAAGEKPDMVLMPVPAIDARVKDGILRGDARAALGTVRIALVVREGAAAPDIATLDSFKKAMLEAKSVVHSNPAATPSGAHLGKAWEQLGIADAMKPKLTFRNALDGGAESVRQGEADIGLYPMSEVIAEQGVKVVGLVPQDVQLNTVYGAAVLAANGAPEPATAFVKFLADPANAKHWQHAGFEPAN
ncbi:MAG: molybdate transport system substrate-binding protein [Hyphomicrobiales bacterium]|jgi:molybdate transport system substrate-binding protein|nr:molybdate transport system substrate-binding protein [Hyphomicrobiales bacterium]